MVAFLRKDIRRFMMIERIVPRVWMYRRRWTLTLGVIRKQCTAQERLEKYGKVEVSTFEYSHYSEELMHLLSVTLNLIRRFTKRQVPRGGVYGGLVILAHPRLMVRECTLIFEPSRG